MENEVKKPITPENTGKNQDTRFRPGQSGNPAGKPRGARNRATMLAEEMLDGQARELIQKAIDLALSGDIDALRLCISRLCPPRKDRPVKISIPPIHTCEDVMEAHAKIIRAVASGKITPEEGSTISGLIENCRKSIETSDIERRILALEKAEDEKRGRQ
jgi:hypothetical protein